MPPVPSDPAGAGRPPEDFAPLLATSEPVLLVGGQAVNLWALYYETRTADLAPFVSRDVDVLGDRATLEALGKLAGTKPQFFPVKPPTNEIGVVIAKDQHGLPLLIEVLRYLGKNHLPETFDYDRPRRRAGSRPTSHFPATGLSSWPRFTRYSRVTSRLRSRGFRADRSGMTGGKC